MVEMCKGCPPRSVSYSFMRRAEPTVRSALGPSTSHDDLLRRVFELPHEIHLARLHDVFRECVCRRLQTGKRSRKVYHIDALPLSTHIRFSLEVAKVQDTEGT